MRILNEKQCAVKPNIFNLSTCELSGSNLLEASAGTGKTFSLAYLYLRLVLEKGLTVEQILVTTFTLAATAELRERIFITLAQAEASLGALCAGKPPSGDAFLIALLAQIRSQVSDDDVLKQRLRLAHAQFDYAHIHTINGFALQLLREHADVLESYAPEEILNDDSEYVRNAYLDLARDNFAQCDDIHIEAIGEAVAGFTSKALFELLADLLRYDDYIDNYKPHLFERAERFNALVDTAIASAEEAKPESIAKLLSKAQLNQTSYSESKICANTARLLDKSAYQDKTFLAFFSQAKIDRAKTAKSLTPPTHRLFAVFDELVANAGDAALLLNIDKYQALLHLSAVLKVRVNALKAEQMALTHDDIVTRVADGANNIPAQFKAALIDEAQDTNLQQMMLFRRLFLQSKETITFFVGDPKQAIYGFRGANIYSYLEIQNEVDHHYLMETNYRSTEALNASVNAAFSGNRPFLTDAITYHPVGWDKANHSRFGDKSLTFANAEDAKSADLAAAGANAINALLNEHHLSPRDIAVLVRSGTQATLMKAALAEYQLSASFTGKLNLYESDEAKWLLGLLNAVRTGNRRVVKSLMLTPLFAYPLNEAHDHDAVNQLAIQLHQFAQIYADKGFNIAFYRLMTTFYIAGRLLQSHDGKRRLTNFIQLFELLQTHQQKQSLSLAGLCDVLSQHIQDADSEAELRLEDANAITIMTMHSAKGLEFPVVCLPFFDYYRKNTNADGLLVCHQNQWAAPKFLQPADLKEQVEKQEDAENRRLAYVALTRAQYHNIIIRQPSKKGDKPKGTMLTNILDSLENESTLTAAGFTSTLPIDTDAIAHKHTAETLCFTPKTLTKPLYSAWQLASFSRLQQQVAPYQTPQPLDKAKPISSPAQTPVIDSALMRYPSGARPGTALHEMYEHFLAHRQNDTDFHQAIDNSIARHLLADDQTTRPDTPAIADAIVATTTIALAPQSFCLQDIARDKQSIEMKFFLHLSPAARQQLLQIFGLTSEAQTHIPTDGYVHGFIDYCFEYNGRFFVLDYKSNRLGESFDDYQQDNMHAEMQHHRYDLQAFIYTLALCKHLRIKTEAQYTAKIGGYFYLFVRGMAANQATGIYADTVAWQDLANLM